MPELPEVETVRGGLEKIFRDKPVIKRVRLLRPDIRFLIPRQLPKRLQGQPVTGVRRRAKYLLIDTPKVILLSHLGMTGSWRLVDDEQIDKHDHCFIDLEDGRSLAFRDPRRFGILDLVELTREHDHPRLRSLGVEPLNEADFTADFLFSASRKRKVPIKVFLMDQRVVVGIGNIYASEALFRARVKPTELAGKVTRDECERLVSCSREILHAAIRSGGSSISDYRNADGGSGAFQSEFLVYDRAGAPCASCGTVIKSKILGGRNTFWCAKCQRRAK